MLRLLVMLILASVHGCITACRATYGLVPKQGQAAKPIAIESASFVAVQISFLQKKKMAVLFRMVSGIQTRLDGLVSSLSTFVLSTVLSTVFSLPQTSQSSFIVPNE
jgi:hypothetical protein